MKVNVNFTDKKLVILFILLCAILGMVGESTKVKSFDPCEVNEKIAGNYIKVCGEAKIYSYTRYSEVVFLRDGSFCLRGVVFSDLKRNGGLSCICAEGEVNYDGGMVIRKIYPCEGNLSR